MKKKIEKIKEIMTGVSTGETRIEDIQEEYKKLYQELDNFFDDIAIENPNKYSDLWEFYHFWKENLPTYAKRRNFVIGLYKDTKIEKEKDRKYYSVRSGSNKEHKISLDSIKEIFYSIYEEFVDKNYFNEYFGYYCIDSNFAHGLVPGLLGSKPESYILRKLRKSNLWPIRKNYKNYSEEDLFDIVEFLYDYISFPLEDEAYYHTYNDCGWHYKNFNKKTGQINFRQEINQYLKDYNNGYELSKDGEILVLSDKGLNDLLKASVPLCDPKNIKERINLAVTRFRSYKSTEKDRREVVRDLADCLEFLRPQLEIILDSKDEKDLFNIANNFAIRHHNQKQKSNYDSKIWLSWMFYFYLATIHAVLRLINKKNKKIKK